jgi:Uma2 family endonuclease
LTALQNSIDQEKCDAIALSEIDWLISTVTVVRPDILVLCGDAPQRHVERTPAIVVEILSPSTEHRDRIEKLEINQEQQVRHYLMLDSDQRPERAVGCGSRLPRQRKRRPKFSQPCRSLQNR